MIIKSLHITDFSGTKDLDVSFGGGFNVIEGPNESGKTTVASFIKFMLYGFRDKAERTRFFSWDSASASGSMTVLDGGGEYRVERICTGAGQDRVTIIDLSNGSPCFEGRSPADVFLGVPAEIFSHTAYIGQAAGGEVDGEKVSAAIENILFSGDEAVNTDRALKKLDEARIRLLYKSRKGGMIYDLRQERDALGSRLDAARRANETLVDREGAVRETRALLEANSGKLAKATSDLEMLDAAEKRRGMEKLKELSDAADRLDAEYRRRCEADGYRGFIPDAAYQAEADWAERDVARINEAIAEAEEQYGSFMLKSGEVESLRGFYERMENAGGADAVVARIGKLRARVSRMKGLAVFAFVLAAVCAAFAVCVYFVDLPGPFAFLSDGLLPTLIGGAAALVMLLLGVAATMSRSRARLEINEILCDVDADSAEEIENRLSTLNIDETRLRIHDSRKAEYEGRLADLRQKKETALASASALAEKWGRTDINGVAAEAAESLQKRTALKNELDKYAMARDTLAAQLGITDIAAALASTVPDGADGAAPGPDELTPQAEDRLKREYDFYYRQNAALTDKLHALEKDLAVLSATVEPADELSAQTAALDERIADLGARHDALVLAYESLEAAADDLRESVSPRLAASAGALMSSLTEGRYRTLGVDGALRLAFESSGQTHGAEYMSAGTRDAAYLSLRFALIELLYNGKKPPLIFDESFSRLDDGRFLCAVRVISQMSQNGVQALLFTSQTRDAALASGCDGEVNVVRL